MRYRLDFISNFYLILYWKNKIWSNKSKTNTLVYHRYLLITYIKRYTVIQIKLIWMKSSTDLLHLEWMVSYKFVMSFKIRFSIMWHIFYNIPLIERPFLDICWTGNGLIASHYVEKRLIYFQFSIFSSNDVV